MSLPEVPDTLPFPRGRGGKIASVKALVPQRVGDATLHRQWSKSGPSTVKTRRKSRARNKSMVDGISHQPFTAPTVHAPWRSWLVSRWRAVSLRGQIVATITLVGLLASAAAMVIVVYNAKKSSEVEVAAAMAAAEQLVRELVAQPQFQAAAQLEQLPARIGQLRHVRVLAIPAADRGRAALMPLPSIDAQDDVPSWFASIVNVEDVRREMQIVSEGRHIGSIVIVGYAADEIAEVWRETRDLFLVALMLGITVLVLLHFAFGGLLRPLEGVAAGLRELERGEFRHRLSRPNIRALAEITDRFNALALRLDLARSENRNLNRRLLTAQDDERRRLASELHDELGPCLFGIRADVTSLEALARRLPAEIGKGVCERIATIDEITDKIQHMNRRLLDRLRPIALDHLPLGEVLGGLISEFQRHGPSPKITLAIDMPASRYDDAVNITVYRCVQEGVTNALRHAQAQRLDVDLREGKPQAGSSRDSGAVLYLSVTDDGIGTSSSDAPGLGLTGMEERVRALGGSIEIAPNPSGRGTCLRVKIPLDTTGHEGFGKLEVLQR
ncbi:ATP-binding protein [Mesorhizobium sp. A556]